MERVKRDAQYAELRKANVEIIGLVQTIKSEVIDKLKENREEYLSIFNQSEDERQRAEKIRFDKAESDFANQKRLLSAFEQKIDQEAD